MLVIERPEDLDPIIAKTVAETLAAIKADEDRLGDRLAFTEPEGARLLSMQAHQLGDERRRGRIGASGICKNGIRYTKQDLLDYLARNRTERRI